MNNKVLIIVVTYNSTDYIGDCFSSLQNITYPKDFYDVLMVDNASTDDTVEIAKKFSGIKIIQNSKNLGFAAGNNVGFEYAVENDFDYVYLLNADTEVELDFLEKVILLAQTDASIAAVQSKLLLFDDKTKVNSIGNEIHYLGFAYAGGHKTEDKDIQVKEITYPSGAAVLLDMKKLQEVGYFNPEFFMYHEDTDLGWRIWLAGYKCMLAPDSVVYHKYEFSRSIKKYYFMERNRYLVLMQNYKWQTLLLILPAGALMDLMMLTYSFLAGWWREELEVYKYFFTLDNYKKISVTRDRVQKSRKVKDRDVMKRFVGEIKFQDLNNPILQYIVNPLFNLYWKIIQKVIWW